jgi:hypothetical protein
MRRVSELVRRSGARCCAPMSRKMTGGGGCPAGAGTVEPAAAAAAMSHSAARPRLSNLPLPHTAILISRRWSGRGSDRAPSRRCCRPPSLLPCCLCRVIVAGGARLLWWPKYRVI